MSFLALIDAQKRRQQGSSRLQCCRGSGSGRRRQRGRGGLQSLSQHAQSSQRHLEARELLRPLAG